MEEFHSQPEAEPMPSEVSIDFSPKGHMVGNRHNRKGITGMSIKKACLLLIMCSLWLQACATMQITRQNLQAVENIWVVRYKTPNLRVKTLTGVIMTFVGGAAIVPTIVGSHVDSKAAENTTRGVIFPDYGELLLNSFVQIVQKEISDWPKMTSVSNPVDKGYEYKDGAFILFDVDHLWITLYGGLTIEGDVTMRNSSGRKIFGRHFFYRSRDFGLRKSQKEYAADNAKLLIEEIPLAAEHTARDLIIKYMKQSL
jgi:hypothetical protein